MPAPASEVVTTAGKKLSKIGKSCPRLRPFKSALVTSEKGIGNLSFALRPDTLTSSKEIREVFSESFACSSCALKDDTPKAHKQKKTVVFIRKNFTNKRGNYSGYN